MQKLIGGAMAILGAIAILSGASAGKSSTPSPVKVVAVPDHSPGRAAR